MNYSNPYYQYPYTMQSCAQPQPQYQQPQQTSYYPLTYVNGIEGAKAFIVSPNQVVYLKDSDSNMLFEKRADQTGRYSLIAYEMNQIDMNSNKPTQNKMEYATKSELEQFREDFIARLNKLTEASENAK